MTDATLRLRSLWLGRLLVMAAFLYPLMAMGVWLLGGPKAIQVVIDLLEHREVVLRDRLMATIATFPRTLCYSAALWFAGRAFFGFARGDYFGRDTSGAIRSLGLVTMALPLVGLVTEPLMSLAVTLAEPEGQRAITLSLTSNQLLTFLFGLGITLFADTQRRAHAIEQENREIV